MNKTTDEMVTMFLEWVKNKHPDVYLMNVQKGIAKAHFEKYNFFYFGHGCGKTFVLKNIEEFEKNFVKAKQ